MSNGDSGQGHTNVGGYLTSVASASETVAGVIEIATNVEATAGTATDKALVPSNLSGIALSTLNNDLSFLSNIVEDTTPQLGGNLDVNSKDIVSASNGNIEIAPDGTGSTIIKGNATGGSGHIVLNCDQNSHGITLKGPAHSAAATYQLVFPTSVGTDGQVLKTDGGDSGSPNSVQLSWVDQASGGGGYTYSAISSNTTAAISYHYSCNTSGSAFTLTLPALSGVTSGQEIRVKLATAGNDLTIDRTGSDTIEGQNNSYTLSIAKSSVTLVANVAGTDWEIV